ncbi:BACON domain-containing protein [Oleiharenicola lentus]|uniref:BACON domain-containing protein n=1 Tax=Oleiharenicola lentus TaxID=2508720 RepID=UPI003F67FC09
MKISNFAAFSVLLALFSVSRSVAAEEPRVDLKVAAGELVVVPSFEACSYYFRPATPDGISYAVDFRRVGERHWQRGFAPVSDNPPGIRKGSLFNLSEATEWEVRVVTAQGVEVIAPVSFRTWSSQPTIAKIIDLSQVPGAEKGIVITDQGTAEGWIKYTAPRGWKISRTNNLNDPQSGAITVRGARYVILENLTVVGGARHGIAIEDSENVRVLNCDISGWGRVGTQHYTNDEKRGKYADANGQLINLDGGVAITRSLNTVVERNYLHDPRGRANSWQYSHPTGPTAVFANFTRGGSVVRWNDFVGSDEHRWNDVIESASNRSPAGGFYRDSDISGNFLAFGNDDGVELEGGGMNVRFYRNKIEGTLCGVSTGASLLGPQFIFENLIVNPGDETGLALMAFKNSHGLPQSGKRHHINNTIYGPTISAYGGYGKPLGDERLGYMRNNIFVVNSARLPGETSRRDNFDGDQFWIDGNAGASSAFLEGLRKIGQEKYGVAAEPRFVSPSEGDFSLAPDSVARENAFAVANLVFDGAHRGALIEDTSEVPFRPLALRAIPRQLVFTTADSNAPRQVRVSLPASANGAVSFEIRQNAVSDWFRVQPASGTVAPGQTLTLTVTVDAAKLKGRPNFKGAFLVRTPEGLSRPVTIYAAANYTEDLRPAAAPHSAYIEAAAVPALASLVRATDAAGVFGGSYVAFSGVAGEPELQASFEVPRAGRYAVMLRASIDDNVMKRRSLELAIDGGKAEAVGIDADYQWNTGASHFRAVFLHALGELQPGRHTLRLAVKGALNLNEVIITETPSPFLAEGRHEAKR